MNSWALNGSPSLAAGRHYSLAILDYPVFPATRHKWAHPTLSKNSTTMFVQNASKKVAVRQMSIMLLRKCQHMATTPQIVMLRCCRWWRQEGVQNMVWVGDNTYYWICLVCSFLMTVGHCSVRVHTSGKVVSNRTSIRWSIMHTLSPVKFGTVLSVALHTLLPCPVFMPQCLKDSWITSTLTATWIPRPKTKNNRLTWSCRRKFVLLQKVSSNFEWVV